MCDESAVVDGRATGYIAAGAGSLSGLPSFRSALHQLVLQPFAAWTIFVSLGFALALALVLALVHFLARWQGV